MEKLRMVKKLLIVTILAGLLGLIGVCAGSDANKTSVANVTNSSDPAGKNTAAANEHSGGANKKSGGQLTVITGADKSAVKVRSTWFT